MQNITMSSKYGPWAAVTGASSGIGKALVLELAKQNFNIYMIGRSGRRLSDLAQEIGEQYHRRTQVVIADLADESGLQQVINDPQQPDIGFFVHAAGRESHGSFADSSLEKELQLLDLNIRSTLRLTHHFSRKFIARGRGGILLVSSLAGNLVSPYFANYASTKSYILSLGTSLRYELKDKGIDVSVLSPGLTDTPMSEQTGKNIDWSQTPMKMIAPNAVAQYALKHFPGKANLIPGSGNRISAFIGGRLFPQWFGKQNATMIRKAAKSAIIS